MTNYLNRVEPKDIISAKKTIDQMSEIISISNGWINCNNIDKEKDIFPNENKKSPYNQYFLVCHSQRHTNQGCWNNATYFKFSAALYVQDKSIKEGCFFKLNSLDRKEYLVVDTLIHNGMGDPIDGDHAIVGSLWVKKGFYEKPTHQKDYGTLHYPLKSVLAWMPFPQYPPLSKSDKKNKGVN